MFLVSEFKLGLVKSLKKMEKQDHLSQGNYMVLLFQHGQVLHFLDLQ
jgi:hypothetical protein